MSAPLRACNRRTHYGMKLWEGRTLDQKRELVEVLTRETARILDKDPGSIYMVIHDSPCLPDGESYPDSGHRGTNVRNHPDSSLVCP